jgi:hypothetical protein
MADFKIRHDNTPNSAKCVRPGCGHVYAAHGSNGFICATCPCKMFMPSAEAIGTVIDKAPVDAFGTKIIVG